ncbi:MAG: CPBP family intramembrane metalloprotease [Kiritimatiellae bacterium]|nr:CPBP family intramembrane metalloprotease [Kiritimatiellia bacterium]
MRVTGKMSVALVLPYAVWMALMLVLPSTAECYATRTLVTSVLLLPCLLYVVRHQRVIHRNAELLPELLWGVAVGALVFAVWVLPEQFAFYRRWFVVGEGGTTAVDKSGMVFKLVRLFGSAFVISLAEELFFRRWLMKFAGFWWMVLLFAVEHDRWLVGAFAGLMYGWLALRKGLASAMVGHVVTNLALGVYVLETGSWQFW